MVENSLGKYWVEHNGDGALYPSDNLYPSSSITSNWKYFIKENIEDRPDKLNPTEITFIDPCCGSGHILVYAFEVFYQIYLKSGFNKKDIPELILKNNLYGLDIDDRAGQLSILSVLLKAREYDKNIFNKEVVRNLNIMSIQESNTISEIFIDNITTNNIKEQAKYLIDNFRNAKEIGSLLLLDKKEYGDLKTFIEKDNTIFGIELRERLNPIIKIAEMLTNKYNIVVTNPPYMNSGVMSSNMKSYISNKYKEVKTDSFSAFVVRNSYFGFNDSYLGFMTPYVWMFIKSYEQLRNNIIKNMKIDSLIQLEYSALEEATVPLCTYILKNSYVNELGTYIRLTDFSGGMQVQNDKILEILEQNNKDYIYNINALKFKKIPSSPIAYWISDKMANNFEMEKLEDIGYSFQGIITGDVNKHLKLWYEVNNNKIKFHYIDRNILNKIDSYFPYIKGGEYRKWYGNLEYIIHWKNDGKELIRSRTENRNYFLKKGITWSLITSAKMSFRFFDDGFLCDVSGSSYYTNDTNLLKYVLGFLNSNISSSMLKVINPTLNLNIRDVLSIPIKVSGDILNRVKK